MKTPTASSNPINRGRTLPTAVHPPTIRVLGVHPLGCSRLPPPHPPFALGQIRDTYGHIITTPKSPLTPPAKELGPKTHKIAFLKRTDNYSSNPGNPVHIPSSCQTRNATSKPENALPSRRLTFPSQVPAITNSNPYSCNTCNTCFPWLNNLLPFQRPQFTHFTLVSPSIHDFTPKKFPLNAPALFSSRENPPISQQINASTCNGQLRPPNRPRRRPTHNFS